MNAAKYLIGKGATVKGHPLCWHTACADWLGAFTLGKKNTNCIVELD